MYSGVAFKETSENIYVLSIAHGPGSEKPIQVEFLLRQRSGFIALPGEFVKKEIARDLSVIKVPKIIKFDMQIYPVADEMKYDFGMVWGFRGYSKLNVVQVSHLRDDTRRGMNDEPLLEGTGTGQFGMSGGPLLSPSSRIVGIQSAKDNNNNRPRIIFAHLHQIHKFLEGVEFE